MIYIDHLDHFYGAGQTRRQVLFDVCASISAGEVVLLTGPSGSGKSTLLSLIGALRSAQGSLTVLHRNLRDASTEVLIQVRRQIGYIFQAHNLLDCLSVLENVQVGLATQSRYAGAAVRRRAVEVLEAVGLSAHLDKYPTQLSGGQQQRVAIARALAGHPRLLLADEPTASLDGASGADVAARIRELAKQEGCAAVVVTHDQRIAGIADRTLAIEDGRLRTGVAETHLPLVPAYLLARDQAVAAPEFASTPGS